MASLCSLPHVFSGGTLEPAVPSVALSQECLLAMPGMRPSERGDLISGLTVDLIGLWLVDPRGKLAGRVPVVSVGFQELSGAGELRTNVGN